MFGEWQNAHEFFSDVRDRASTVDRVRGKVLTMEERLGVKAQGYEPSVSGTRGDVNGTAQLIAKMDYEAETDPCVRECYRLIDLGTLVEANLYRFINPEHVKVMAKHYELGMKRSAIAAEHKVSVTCVDNWIRHALDSADLIGWDALTRR